MDAGTTERTFPVIETELVELPSGLASIAIREPEVDWFAEHLRVRPWRDVALLPMGNGGPVASLDGLPLALRAELFRADLVRADLIVAAFRVQYRIQVLEVRGASPATARCVAVEPTVEDGDEVMDAVAQLKSEAIAARSSGSAHFQETEPELGRRRAGQLADYLAYGLDSGGSGLRRKLLGTVDPLRRVQLVLNAYRAQRSP